MASQKPRIALFCGDPAEIGPELVQKLLDDPSALESAHIHLIGQKNALRVPSMVSLHDWNGLHSPPFECGLASKENGRYMLDGLKEGLGLVQAGKVDAICFTLNTYRNAASSCKPSTLCG